MRDEPSLNAAWQAPSRLLQAAIPFLFLMLGITYASWGARLPAIRDALSLDPATLGTVLLGGGIGSVCSFPLAAWLVGHLGARHGALASGVALLIMLPVLALLPDWRVLMLGMVAMGLAASCFDVAINALGAEAERDAGRSIMSMLHAWFCVGTFVGALLGSAAAAVSLAPRWHFLLTSIGLALPFLLAYRILPCDRPDPELGRKHFALPHGALVWLGMIALMGAITEGSLSSWIALYLRDHLHASLGLAPLGYAAFAAAMLVARLAGDRLKEIMGARRLVARGSLIGAAGLVLAVLAPNIPIAIIGFAVAGIGVAAVFPCMFSAAGREGAAALAAVATMGYSGGLLGPPVMGYVVHVFSLQAGLLLLCATSIAVAFAAGRARLLD
ncbi:MAG: MFS transporter [Burkholderiales bacterium]|nr:MFS transporter [Burkholderiales bacterium]